MLLVPSWMSSAEIFYLPWKYIHLLSKQIHINPKGKLWQYCRQQAAEVSQSFQLNLSVKSLPGRQTLIRLGTHFAVMWPNRNKRIRCILRLGIKLVHGAPVEARNKTGLKNSFFFQICSKTGFTVHTGAKLADAQSQLSAALQLQAGSHVSKDSIFLQKKKLKISGRGGE